MEENNYQVQEETVSLKQIIALLFGNIKTYIIIAAISLVVTFVALYFVNSSSKNYEQLISFDAPGLTDTNYIDGSKFDCRDLVTYNKLLEYQEKYEDLKGLDMKKIYQKGGISKFEYKEVLVENTQKLKDDDPDYLVESTGYYIEIQKKYFTEAQAATLVEAISNEPLSITIEKIGNMKYDANLDLYKESKKFDDAVSALEAQLELIYSKYDSLIKEFGNQTVPSTSGVVRTIEEVKSVVNKDMQNYSLESIANELRVAGYIKQDNNNNNNSIKDLQQQYEQYTKDKEKLIKDQEIVKKEKTELETMVNTLVESSKGSGTQTSSLQTLELSAYNNQIVALNSKYYALQKEIDDITTKIANLYCLVNDVTSYEEGGKVYTKYTDAQLEDFSERLNTIYEKIDKYTKELTEVVKTIQIQNINVYYKNAGFVKVQEGDMKMSIIAIISVAVAIFFPMVVNCCIAIVDVTKESTNNKKEEAK